MVDMTSKASDRRPRVLYVTYTVPWNPRYGGALRCFGVIRALAACCDLHVAFAGDDPGSREAFMTWSAPANLTRHALLANNGWDNVSDRSASRSVQAAVGKGKYSGALKALWHALEPDIIWYFEVETLRRTTLLRNVPVVLDHCDVRWRKQMRQAQLETGRNRWQALFKAGLLRVDDLQLSLRVRHSLVASPDEVSLLWPARGVSVLPNGFDFPLTAPQPSANSNRLLFYGSLFYKPNADGVRWLCQEVWPLILARRPDARLDVVGLGHEALADLTRTPGVTFHGFVDDLEVLQRQAAALVVPLRVAGGTRIKILEAWAKGLPVVSTTIGAEGLAAQDGVTVLLGDAPEAFAARCLTVLEDGNERQRLAVAGYEHGRSRYEWSVIGLEIENLLLRFSY